MKLGHIPNNYFRDRDLPGAVGVADKDYVPEIVIDDVLEAPEDLEWKLRFAFGRYVACRMPSEIQQLAWDHIDWEANTILLHSPKTRNLDKPRRKAPISPEVRDLLKQQLEANLDEAHVFPTLRHHRNQGATAKKLLTVAGHKP